MLKHEGTGHAGKPSMNRPPRDETDPELDAAGDPPQDETAPESDAAGTPLRDDIDPESAAAGNPSSNNPLLAAAPTNA